MEDERPLVVDLDQLRQLLLWLLDVDERVARVVEHPEEAVDADVDARRLQQRLVVGVDPDPTLREQPPDRPVGEDHAAILRPHPAGAPARLHAAYARMHSTARCAIVSPWP